MVKIENKQNFELLNSHYLIKKYIEIHYNSICKNFDCKDLKQTGAIFYLSDISDLSLYSNTGISLSFDKAIYESAELITINDRETKMTIFQVVYLLNNDMAITVIFDMKSLDELTKSWLLEDFTERTIII